MSADVTDWYDLRDVLDDAIAALQHARRLLDWLDGITGAGDRDGNVPDVRKPMPLSS